MIYYIAVVVHLPLTDDILFFKVRYKTTVETIKNMVIQSKNIENVIFFNKFHQEIPYEIDLRGDIELYLR